MTNEPHSRPLLQLLLDFAEAFKDTDAGRLPKDARTYERSDLEGVIVDALTRGVIWPQILVHTARMLARREELRDLRLALADPAKPYNPKPLPTREGGAS